MNRALIGSCGLVALAVGLGGCASRTPVSGSFPSITPKQAQGNQYTGRTVRWGGVLIKTKPQAGSTCFHVMGLPLDSDGRPRYGAAKTNTGRFIACAKGFYDPVLYAAGRKATFIGTVSGVKAEAVGGYQYPYPRLRARVVYLWPKVSLQRREPYVGPYIWGPWSPWGPQWWWSTYGYWPPPHRHDHDHDRQHHHLPPPAHSTGGHGSVRHSPPPVKIRQRVRAHWPAASSPTPPRIRDAIPRHSNPNRTVHPPRIRPPSPRTHGRRPTVVPTHGRGQGRE